MVKKHQSLSIYMTLINCSELPFCYLVALLLFASALRKGWLERQISCGYCIRIAEKKGMLCFINCLYKQNLRVLFYEVSYNL